MMTIAELIVPEFDQEMAGTRRVIERVPKEKLDWKAHPKSNTIGWVASHLVEIPGWVEGTLTSESWDIHPPGEEAYTTPSITNPHQALELFDANVAAARKAIAATSDEEFAKQWSLLMQGKPLFTMTKYEVIRSMVINHLIHHRGILTVYLRLNDISVPGLYGPSGDE